METLKPKARIRLEYKVQYPNPIQVRAGESVQVEREDDDYPGWFWCRAADGREGWMPCELLSRQGAVARALQDYSAKELAVQPGDEVEVEEVRHAWVLVRNAKDERGWIPKSHLES
jgi:SH3-like domain-containing protein